MDLYALGCGERDSRDEWKADWSSTRVLLGVLAFRKFKTSLMESKCGLIVRNLSVMIVYRFKSYGSFLNWSRYFINWTSFRCITYRSKFMQMIICITIKLNICLRRSVMKWMFIFQILFNDSVLLKNTPRTINIHAHVHVACFLDMCHDYGTQTARLERVSFVVYLFLRLPVFVFLVFSKFLFFLPLNIMVTEN
jgi:hypothetical protein